jgi:uncharacterized protein (TIGR00645 family)
MTESESLKSSEEVSNSTETNVKQSEKTRIETWLDNYFEPVFFELRYAILLPVIVGFFAALVMFVIGSYHVFNATTALVFFGQFSSSEVTLPIIKALDAYLVGIILIIFSFGVYDFFISELDPADNAGIRPDWFKFDSTGDLKNKLIEVVLVILAIKFFEQMVANVKNIETIEMYLVIPVGAAILAVSLGFFKWATH